MRRLAESPQSPDPEDAHFQTNISARPGPRILHCTGETRYISRQISDRLKVRRRCICEKTTTSCFSTALCAPILRFPNVHCSEYRLQCSTGRGDSWQIEMLRLENVLCFFQTLGILKSAVHESPEPTFSIFSSVLCCAIAS